MSTKASGQKTLRLMNLEEWARRKYQPEQFQTKEFRAALKEYSMMTWELSSGRAENMAEIVQLRLTRKMPKSLTPPPARVAGEENMTLLEIIQGHKDLNPAEYQPKKTDFTVIEEG